MASDVNVVCFAGDASVEVGAIVERAAISVWLRASCVVDDGVSEERTCEWSVMPHVDHMQVRILCLRWVQSALTFAATLALSMTLCTLVSGQATMTDNSALLGIGARATLPIAFGLLTLTTRLAAIVWRGGMSLRILLAKLN